jgi:hypothetical protein
MNRLAKALLTVATVGSAGLGPAVAETCFENHFDSIGQQLTFAANDANASVQYKVCISSSANASADIGSPTRTLVTVHYRTVGAETGCVFVMLNSTLIATLTDYEGPDRSSPEVSLSVCALP